MLFTRVQGKCQYDESLLDCYANKGRQNISCKTSHCCSHLRLRPSLFALRIQYDVRFTKCNVTAPFGYDLSICNVSRVTAVPFKDMCASNTPAVRELANGVNNVALR